MRSNAKRHLRTHGIFPTSDHNSSSQSQFTVGFDTPMVSDVHEVGKLPSKLRWIPQSLSTRTNAEYLRDAPSDSEEEYLRPSCPMLPVPLPAVRPSSPTWPPDDNYEERDSFADAETSPYLPSQVRAHRHLLLGNRSLPTSFSGEEACPVLPSCLLAVSELRLRTIS